MSYNMPAGATQDDAEAYGAVDYPAYAPLCRAKDKDGLPCFASQFGESLYCREHDLLIVQEAYDRAVAEGDLEDAALYRNELARHGLDVGPAMAVAA